MNLDHHEAISLVDKLTEYLNTLAKQPEVSVHPSFTSIRSVQTILETRKTSIALGAQNCHWEDSGAFTGEVSPLMLKKLNVKYVIIGHSERRIFFHETDEIINRKISKVFAHGMVPILCVGESKEERDASVEKERVAAQLKIGLDGLKRSDAKNLVIAYEPIWAIGTGSPATERDAQQMASFIRSEISSLKGSEVAESVRILYGGSVNSLNSASFIAQPDIDGALVGGASLKVEEFFAIIKSAVKQ